MKKNTQHLFFLMLLFLSVSAFAQTTNTTGLSGADLIFYEDLRYYREYPASPVSGYLCTVTTATNTPSNNALIPTPAELGYTRPANNYPAGDPVDSKSARHIANTSTENHATDVWFVVNSVDLSGYDSGSKYFTFSTRSQYREDGGTNIDDDTTVYYSTGFTTGSDPTGVGVTWTPVTPTPLGPSDIMGADGVWTTQYIDLSSIVCGTEFAIAIRRQTSATGPTGGAFDPTGNRNGFFWLSDLTYTGSSVPLSLNDDLLKEAVNIYPNPVNNILNIDIVENIEIEKLRLIDVLGKTVYTSKNTNSIDVSNFAKGLYILKITSNDNNVLSKKVIID